MLTLAFALTVFTALDSLERAGRICSDEAVRSFYTRRGGAAAWDDANAAALERAIAQAGDEALDPKGYPLPSEGSADERDVLLTDAFLTYGTHLLRGRLNPEFAWCSAPRELDLAALLESALSDRTVEQVLPRLAPRHDGYRKLRQAWQVYRAMVDWTAIPSGPTMRVGDHGPRVARLRERLGLATSDEPFDAQLRETVRDFQHRHGLLEDGIVGPRTLAELNVSRLERIRQLGWNLERWRWMPDDLGERYLLVNVAAFDAALVENGSTTLRMRIVAGKELTRTPFFTARVEAVTVNPPWNVPESIASRELWPKQRRDPGYFAREKIRVLPGGRLRQDPGPSCALGRIKLEMPNRYNVYLHDTPSRSLFATDLRAFSHGCIRMEKPVEMASALTGRSIATIEELIAGGRQKTIPLERALPVYVLYWTAFVDEEGVLHFRRDVYGQDAAMSVAALARRP